MTNNEIHNLPYKRLQSVKQIDLTLIRIAVIPFIVFLAAGSFAESEAVLDYRDEGIKMDPAGITLTGIVRVKSHESTEKAFERARKKSIWRLVLYCIDKEFEIPGLISAENDCLVYVLQHLEIQNQEEIVDGTGNRIAKISVALRWMSGGAEPAPKILDDYTEKINRRGLYSPFTDEDLLEKIPKVGPGENGPFDSLIIDARGSGLTRSHVVMVMEDDSRIGSDPDNSPKAKLIKEEAVKWVNSMEEAVENIGMENLPIFLKVCKIEQATPVKIWIEDQNLSRLRKARIEKLLEGRRVIVVF